MEQTREERKISPIRDALKEVARGTVRKYFLPEYRSGIKDEEALGVAVSVYFEWSGKSIMEAFAYALEDANYHDKCAEVRDWIGEMFPGEAKPEADGMVRYPFSEWMKKYRPDGLGRIGVSVPGEPETVVTFTEVVCDLCNAEIPPKDETGEESTVVMYDNDALCEECAARILKERETPHEDEWD